MTYLYCVLFVAVLVAAIMTKMKSTKPKQKPHAKISRRLTDSAIEQIQAAIEKRERKALDINHMRRCGAI